MLKLTPNPTFVAPVKIPVPGGVGVTIKVEFKHMSKADYAAFIQKEQDTKRSDEDAIMDVAVGWSEVDGEFNRENVARLCQHYHGAANAIAEAFIEQLTQFRRGN